MWQIYLVGIILRKLKRLFFLDSISKQTYNITKPTMYNGDEQL